MTVRTEIGETGRLPTITAAAVTIFGVCFSLIAGGCGKESVEEAPVARPVKIVTVSQGDAMTVEYPGVLQAALHADMGFEVSGRVTEFLVKEGERVTEGAVLARLDDRDYQARLDVAKADLRKAKADQQRGKSIHEEDPGAISVATLDTERQAVEVAEAVLREAQKAVEDTILVAPFDGVMARKLVEDFANVNAKDPVLILQNDSHLEIVISIPERDIPAYSHKRAHDSEKVTVVTKPEVIVTSLPDRRFAARVKEFTTTADPETRTFQATFIFENPDDVIILPGMTAKVQVDLAQQGVNRLAIPANAARADANGKAFVWLVDPSSMTVREAPVELGQLSGADVAVLSGLSPGDQVAISGVHQLRDGMQVLRFER